MATTGQLLTWAELEMHGWQREGPRGSRACMNEAHTILLTNKTLQNIIYDQATGDLPFVVTQNNVFRYNLPANVWLLEALLVDADANLGYGLTWGQTDWRLEDKIVGAKSYRRILNITSVPATPSTVAWLQFVAVNPGATTEFFRGLTHRRPVQIVSDAIQHEMPGDTDVRFLLPATIMLIQAIDDHTKAAEARKFIETVLKPGILKDTNLGAFDIIDTVTKRPF